VSRHGTASTHLADELLQPADLGIRTRLRSALTTSLPVSPIRRKQLSTVGDRAFPVAAARTWNDLPRHVTSASSLPVFRSRLTTHLFRRSFSQLLFSACEVTLVIIDTMIVLYYLLNLYTVYTLTAIPSQKWYGLVLSAKYHIETLNSYRLILYSNSVLYDIEGLLFLAYF